MIIGITGYKTAGKDSIADVLIENGFEKYSFADPIKEIAKIMFGWGDEMFTPANKEKFDEFWGLKIREPLLALGTEFAQYTLPSMFPEFDKRIGRKLWVKRFERWYESHRNENIVIPDMRFPHEQEVLRKYNAVFVRVNREQAVPKGAVHESESYVPQLEAHYEIDNNSTLDNLRDSVLAMLKGIKGSV